MFKVTRQVVQSNGAGLPAGEGGIIVDQGIVFKGCVGYALYPGVHADRCWRFDVDSGP